MTLLLPPTQKLADTGRIAALYQPRGSDTLLVSLAPRQDRRSIWGQVFLARLGVSVLGLLDHSAAWYPQAEMARLLPALQGVLAAHRRVVLYGFSMGGYAALKYAAALRADTVLAFSPQYSVHPDDVGDFDLRRSREDFEPALHAGMRITAGDVAGQALLFRDPLFANDVIHAERIAAAAPVRLLPTPFTGHDSVRLAAEAGWVEPLLRAALQGPVPEALLRRHLRPRRLRSQHYVSRLATALTKRRGIAAGLPWLRQALAAGNPGARPRLLLMQGLLDLGEVVEAGAVMAAGFPQPPRGADLALLAVVQAQLARHTGHDLPPAPEEALPCQAALDFLRDRLLPGESVLAPPELHPLPPGAIPVPPQPEGSLPDWTLLRHAALASVGQGFLRRLVAEAVPVFAEEAVSLWAGVPSLGLFDRSDHPTIRRLRRDLARDWRPGGAPG